VFAEMEGSLPRIQEAFCLQRHFSVGSYHGKRLSFVNFTCTYGIVAANWHRDEVS